MAGEQNQHEVGVQDMGGCDKIRQFKDSKLVELNSVKQNAEGEEEKRILRSHLKRMQRLSFWTCMTMGEFSYASMGWMRQLRNKKCWKYALSLKDQEASGSLVAKTIPNEKLSIATRFLETLAFVCQMRKAARDFKLDECASEVSELWQDGEAARTEAQQLLFTPQGKPLVGLLADVGDGSCRFSPR